MKEMMKAIVASAYGDTEVLKLKRIKKPQPKEDEVLVKVYVASATTADGMMRSGKPYFGRLMTGITKPKHSIPGTGFAGVVDAVGEKVKRFATGDRVFGETTLGFSTNAEYFTITESGVIMHMPDNLSYTDAATWGDGAVTSLNFLKIVAGVKPGQRVLINGASGSQGTAAVQIAKYMGAVVTAVCSIRNIGMVKSLGADHVIDYTKKDFSQTNEKYDVIYDTIGKSSFHVCKKILTKSGIYVSPVLKLSLLLQMLGTFIFGKKKAKFTATGLRTDAELKELFNELTKMFRESRLKTVIDRQYPLEKIAEAHTYIASWHKKGNVVIIVQPENI